MSRIQILVVGTDPAEVREVALLIAPLIKPLEEICSEHYTQIDMFELHPTKVKVTNPDPAGSGYIDLFLAV